MRLMFPLMMVVMMMVLMEVMIKQAAAVTAIASPWSIVLVSPATTFLDHNVAIR